MDVELNTPITKGDLILVLVIVLLLMMLVLRITNTQADIGERYQNDSTCQVEEVDQLATCNVVSDAISSSSDPLGRLVGVRLVQTTPSEMIMYMLYEIDSVDGTSK